MIEEQSSSLVIAVERQQEPGSDKYASRQLRVYLADPQAPNKVSVRRGYSMPLRNLGDAIAFVPVYREGMLDKFGVDAVVEIDGGPVIDNPLFLQHSSEEVLTGKPGEHEYFKQQGMSWESVSARSDRMAQLIQKGFMPGQEVRYALGQTPDQRKVELKITDMRPKPPVGIPSAEPLRRA